MWTVVFLVCLLALGPLAVRYGRDSVRYEERPRRWWPGAPRGSAR